MIKLAKGNRTFNVATELQAAAFKNNGWKVVEADSTAPTNPEKTNTNEKSQYKKSDITQMKVEDLKKLAAGLEIEGAEETTGDKLKEAIIAKLGL